MFYENNDDLQLYPAEFISSINPLSLASHKLILKPNKIIMLLRNLNTKRGWVNGTRMINYTLKWIQFKANVTQTNKMEELC